MGTIVYESMLQLVLDDGDYTLDELIDIAKSKYDLEEGDTKFNLSFIIKWKSGRITKLPDGKYHKVKDFCDYLKIMLGGSKQCPEGYFDHQPKLKHLYDDLEQKYGAIIKRRPDRNSDEDIIPF